MAEPWKTSPDQPDQHDQHEPRVTIEMGGDNIVIRSTAAIDRAYTMALAHAVNAAADTDTVVVIDPEPIRCDDSFAAHSIPRLETSCPAHLRWRPFEVEVVRTGVIRIAAAQNWWTIDLQRGRFCQTDNRLDIRFLDPSAWTAVIAVCVTPTQLSALTTEQTLITNARAHRDDRVALSA